jgi:NAD(P)-dependent dehydrogenase (short-subunit alcohol dehydrogenase family)
MASGDHEVTVNAICPGYVDTDMTRGAVERVASRTGMPEEEAIGAVLGSAAQRRLIQPEEIASAVLQLCRHEARGINGQCIVVDGGALLA